MSGDNIFVADTESRVRLPGRGGGDPADLDVGRCGNAADALKKPPHSLSSPATSVSRVFNDNQVGFKAANQGANARDRCCVPAAYLSEAPINKPIRPFEDHVPEPAMGRIDREDAPSGVSASHRIGS